jgi:hypothetical protein
MLKNFLFISLSILSLSSQSVFAMYTNDGAPDRGGPTTLTCKFGRVERAGVAIVKDYGPTTVVPTLRYTVLVAADAHRTHTTSTGAILRRVNFPAGGCEKNDQYSTVTAVEELYEETGKAIALSSTALQPRQDPHYHGYAYSGDFAPTNTKYKSYNQLFWYRKDDASVNKIDTALAAAASNRKLSKRFKETNKAYALPLQDILDRARLLHHLETTGQDAKVRAEENYIFQSRGKGDGTGRVTVYLDPQYLRNLARDITRDANNLSTICWNISGGAVQ